MKAMIMAGVISIITITIMDGETTTIIMEEMTVGVIILKRLNHRSLIMMVGGTISNSPTLSITMVGEIKI